MTSVDFEKDSLSRRRGFPGTLNHDYSGIPTIEIDDDREEKPWQRVIYKIGRKGENLYEPIKSVPSSLLLLVLGFYLLLGYLTQVIEHDMPRVVNEASVNRNDSTTFSEEVAHRYLLQIVGDEPRVAGAPYHLAKTRDMKSIVDAIAAQATIPVQTDWQFATGDYFFLSGSYHMNRSTSYTNYYENTSNIIALLEGESGFYANGTIGSSILVNCHYDSVPYALGASDNSVFCAVMAETLSRMSKRSTKLKHNIVFLFNGAEENGLQASHGFLQHPWARGVISVVNLDSAGINGKASIFQVTDPRLVKAYGRSVYRPSAQGLGEYLFSSGTIPSDTDFRIWRDFGGINGVDIAFTKGAAVYHTRYDEPSLLEPGVIQCAGNMILNLMTELGDEEALLTKVEDSTAVYYDFLNWFLVSYSFTAAIFMDLFVMAIAIMSVAYYVSLVGFRWSTMKELGYSAFGRLVSMVAGVVVTAILVLIMIATTVQMRYIPEPWIVVPLFWMPYLVTAVGVAQLYDAWRLKTNGLNRSIRALQAMAATRLLLSILLLVLLCIPALNATRYIVAAPLLIMSIMSIAMITVMRYVTLTGWQHMLCELVLSAPSAMFWFSLALRFNAILAPIMARSAGDRPDLTVALVNLGLAVLVSSSVSGIELLFSRKRLWMVGSALGVAILVIMFLPISPYNEDKYSVQRHYWFHTEIVSVDYNNVTTDRTTGVMVSKMDPYNTESVVPALNAAGVHVNTRRDFDSDCDNKVYCGLPLFRTSFSRHLNKALFIYSGGPAAFSPAASLSANKSCVGNNCTFNFVMIGAYHNTITLWPVQQVTLTSWSLSSPPHWSFTQLDRPVYVIVHSTATYDDRGYARFEFSVSFNVPISQQSQPIVEVSLHSHKIYHPESYTDEYRNMLQAMPSYFNVATFQTFRYNYVF